MHAGCARFAIARAARPRAGAAPPLGPGCIRDAYALWPAWPIGCPRACAWCWCLHCVVTAALERPAAHGASSQQLDWHWHWHWPYVRVLGPVRLAAGFFSSQNVFVNTMHMHARFYIHGATPEEDKHASSCTATYGAQYGAQNDARCGARYGVDCNADGSADCRLCRL